MFTNIAKLLKTQAQSTCNLNWSYSDLVNKTGTNGNVALTTIACGIEKLLFTLRNITLFLSLIFIVVGGILYITSSGDPEKATKARQTVTWAVVI